MYNMKDLKILVIEDQLDQCAIIVERLEVLTRDDVNYRVAVDVRTTYDQAEKALRANVYDAILVDTSQMAIDEVVATLENYVKEKSK